MSNDNGPKADAPPNGDAGKKRSGPGVNPAQIWARYQLATMALTGADPLMMVGFLTEMMREHYGMEGIMLANSVEAVVSSHFAAKETAKPGLVDPGGRRLS